MSPVAAAAVGAACLSWLIPSALLSGGLGAYANAVASQSGSITGGSVLGDTGASALWYDVRFVALALGWGLFALGIVNKEALAGACGVLAAGVALFYLGLRRYESGNLMEMRG